MSDGSTLPPEKTDRALMILACSKCYAELPLPNTPHSCRRSLDDPIPPLMEIYKCPDCRVQLRFRDPDGKIGECPLCNYLFHK